MRSALNFRSCILKLPACLGVIAGCLFSNIALSQQVIPLSDYAGHPNLKVVEVTIDGKKFDFLFDTGAGVTLVTPGVLQHAGKESYGSSVGYRMKGEKVEYKMCDSLLVQLGGYSFFHRQVGVWDVNKVLPKDWPQIHGVISLATFEESCISLDLGNNQIIVESESGCTQKMNSDKLVNAVFANGFSGMENSIFIEEPKNGNTYRFLMDSGNLDKVKVSYATCHDWGIVPDTTSDRQDVGHWNYSLSDKSIQIPTVVDKIIYDGVFNFDLMALHVITISFYDKKVSIR